MSRTPEIMVSKKKEAWQGRLIGGGLFTWLLAYGAFQNEGGEGTGMVLGILGGVFLYGASKIKTKYKKTAEMGVYR